MSDKDFLPEFFWHPGKDPDELVKPETGHIGPVDFVINWARQGSLWWLTFGLACCAIEQISLQMSRYDLERIGAIPRASPRQADVLIVSGWVSKKSVPMLKTLYQQMAEPKYVISMGSCANSGGIHSESPMIVRGVDQFLPVDVYCPGCPPRPEALLSAFIDLQKKITSGPAAGVGKSS